MKYLTLGIHYPKPEHKEDILSAIRKVAEIAHTLQGLIETGAWHDEAEDRIILFSLWQSAEHALEASKTLRPMIMQSPWSEWERKPSENFLNLKQLV